MKIIKVIVATMGLSAAVASVVETLRIHKMEKELRDKADKYIDSELAGTEYSRPATIKVTSPRIAEQKKNLSLLNKINAAAMATMMLFSFLDKEEDWYKL